MSSNHHPYMYKLVKLVSQMSVCCISELFLVIMYLESIFSPLHNLNYGYEALAF